MRQFAHGFRCLRTKGKPAADSRQTFRKCDMCHSSPSASHRLGRKIRFAYVDVAITRHHLAALPIHGFIARLRCPQAIHVPVVHAEGCCDQNRIVNLDIRCAQAARVGHIFSCYMLASALHFTCNHKQSLQFFRNISVQKISLDAAHQLLIAIQMGCGNGAMDRLAVMAIVQIRHVSRDQLAFPGRKTVGSAQENFNEVIQWAGRFRAKRHRTANSRLAFRQGNMRHWISRPPPNACELTSADLSAPPSKGGASSRVSIYRNSLVACIANAPLGLVRQLRTMDPPGRHHQTRRPWPDSAPNERPRQAWNSRNSIPALAWSCPAPGCTLLTPVTNCAAVEFSIVSRKPSATKRKSSVLTCSAYRGTRTNSRKILLRSPAKCASY